MLARKTDQLTLVKTSGLGRSVAEFIIDCKARALSAKTVNLYQSELLSFRRFLSAQGIEDAEAIAARHIRAYLINLADRRKAAGVHCAYRIIKTFLRWYEREYEPEGWPNPIRKVKAPKVPNEPLKPVPLEDLRAMLNTCQRKTFTGDRDRALLTALLDSGCRASELLSLHIGDVSLESGAVIVRQGKGGKFRTVFFGARTRRALLRYLRHRPEAPLDSPLWTAVGGGPLTYWGLRQMVRRRATRARVPTPSLHSFRRAFALLCLRNEVDVYSLQRLMGHADLSVLRRYLAQTEDDLRRAHQKGGPVDNML